ncbi:REP-associated tyrosine transposase [Telluribacter sp. SYSU D00476]|uniref:REP-associated tyrosine transposase n=1 Tax=Telluribacter sp. SYSU D00476 TaxID=2811430 RepID=UPI001FF35D09|nr:transposase [Telluribacter sp. SYSU D00476]
MSELRKTYEGGVFFLTLTVVGWMDVFTRPLYVNEIVKSLQFCQQKKGLELYAYVIMTNHLHLIARRTEGELSEVLRDFKSFTAKQLLNLLLTNPQESRKDWMEMVFRYHGATTQQNDRYAFWQKTNHPIELTSPSVILQKIEYIHQNPVRAGFVQEPHEWQWSSANPQSPVKVLAF